MTLATLTYSNAEKYGDRPAIRAKVDGVWTDTSYADNAAIVDRIAQGLLALDIAPGERVCILSETRPAWVQVAAAVHAVGATVVPIYPSSSADECEWVIGNSGAVAVFCENDAQVAKVETVAAELPELRHVVAIDAGASGKPTLSDVVANGISSDVAEVRARAEAVRDDDLAIIIYTSGTTGRPKGCMLTHANLRATNRASREVGLFHDGDVAYLYLPLAHIFAQCVPLVMSEVGGTVAFVSGGTDRIVPDLAEVRPTYLPSVPRIFEKIYSAVTRSAPADVLEKGVAAALDARAAEQAGREVPEAIRHAAEQVRPFLDAGRAVLGGRVSVAISGAAPISPAILEFFSAAGVPVHEGYGLSESGGIGTLNVPGGQRFGSIGVALPGIEVEIAEDGEILLRGGNNFAGYWKNSQATEEMLIDGWLHTGDLGSKDEDGLVTITGRKKDIIITAGGKNLTPANIENDLRQHPLISQALMHGDRRPYPVALITLDAEAALPWAKEQGLPGTVAELADHAVVRNEIQRAIDLANAGYAQVAQVKRFAILPHDLTQEAGELTPTLKMKRAVIYANHADVLDSLYGK